MAARASAREVAAIGGELEVRTAPFSQDFVDELKLAVPKRHRHWDADEKVWRIAGAFAKPAIAVLLDHYPLAEVPPAYARPKPTPVARPRPEPVLTLPARDVQPVAAPFQLTATVTCPKCHRPYALPIAVTAETSSKVAKRSATPEFVAVCPACHALAVLSFTPARAAEDQAA